MSNVRSTVTAEPLNYAYLAGMEISQANVEQLVFENIPNVRDWNNWGKDIKIRQQQQGNNFILNHFVELFLKRM